MVLHYELFISDHCWTKKDVAVLLPLALPDVDNIQYSSLGDLHLHFREISDLKP